MSGGDTVVRVSAGTQWGKEGIAQPDGASRWPVGGQGDSLAQGQRLSSEAGQRGTVPGPSRGGGRGGAAPGQGKGSIRDPHCRGLV